MKEDKVRYWFVISS